MDYLPWPLSQLSKIPSLGGCCPLDVFTVHDYPQGGELGNATSTATQLLRNRSTRSLWDPNYVDQSWIGTQVELIPRLQNWVNTYHFAGTPVGITEYNWGAESYINGATTQADILGIFGREAPRSGHAMDHAGARPLPRSKPSRCIATMMGRNRHSATPAYPPRSKS